MKKLLAGILALIMVTTLFSCNKRNKGESSSTSDSGEDSPQYVSLLSDRTFKRGFTVRGLGAPIYGDKGDEADQVEYFGRTREEMYDPGVVFDYEKGGDKTPVWSIAQWATRYPFHDKQNTTDSFNYRFTDEGGGKYLYENRSKTVEVDTESGDFRLALKASECYVHGDRVEGQEWPHLLIERNIGSAANPSDEVTISKSQSLKVTVDAKLNSFSDHMQGEANPGLHSAICMFYVMVSHKPEGSKAYTDMIWLGFTVFDNRSAYPNGMSGVDSLDSKGSATGKWIYNIGSSVFASPENNLYDYEGNNMVFDKWMSIEIELLPHVQRALSDAQHAGFMKGATMDTLYVSGMYIGFELPGTYDIDMSFRNMDIVSLV